MAIAHVQSRATYVTDDGSLAFLSDVAAGALIVVSIHAYDNAVELVSPVTDTRGNTYARVGTTTIGGDGSLWLDLFYAYNSTAGPCTVSVNFTGSVYCSFAIHEYSGATTTDPLDQLNPATGTGAAVDSGNTPTTTNADDLIFGCMTSMAGSNVSITPLPNDGTWHQRQEYEDGSAQMHLSTIDKNVAATGAYNAAWTLGSSQGWIAKVAAFKAAAVVAHSDVPPTIARRMAHMFVR